MVNVLIKNMDELTYKQAKLMAVQENKTIGEIFGEAVRHLVLQRKAKKKRLSDIGPFDFGPGSERLSQQVDEIVYG